MGRGGHMGRELSEHERLRAAVDMAQASAEYHAAEVIEAAKRVKYAQAKLTEFLAPMTDVEHE